MHVVATAGHVDHGKSTLVRALTGMEPDRWAEERRRGMTIDLGFAWTDLPGAGTVAFVDVPGHERFVPNMLAGVGPVPAALVVVAADGGWMPQTEEHVAALDALGVRHGLLAVTRADLADPAPAVADARARLAGTSLGAVEAVPVCAPAGHGLPELRAALARLVTRLPDADAAGAVRLWVDRAFTIRGSGTVVTGTLPAGTLRPGDELDLATADRPPTRVVVRGLQALGRPAEHVPAVARVAVNLRGVGRDDVGRGDALLTPGAWWRTGVVDVDVGGDAAELAPSLVLHVGAAAVPARVRPLGARAARLALARPLPLRVADVGLLRDPGRHRVVGRATVLDVDPAPLRRRGAAATRARELSAVAAEVAAAVPGRADGATGLRRRRLARAEDLRAMGYALPPGAPSRGWLVDPGHAADRRAALLAVVAEHATASPLEPGPTVEAVRARLDLPDRDLVLRLVQPPLAVRAGRVVDTRRGPDLPPALARAVTALATDLAGSPWAAPDAARLAGLGLGPRELAAAVRAGALLRVADGVVLLPGADDAAARVLAALPQPFTLSSARQALGTSRRVAVPLLELLDRRGLTRRLPDDRRTTVPG